MNAPRIPARERDLAYEDPQIPPASRQVSSVTNSLFGWLTVSLGVMVIIIAAGAAFFHTSPLPSDLFNADEMTAAFLAMGCGLCLIGSGIFNLRRSILWSAALLVAAVFCGFLSTVIA